MSEQTSARTGGRHPFAVALRSALADSDMSLGAAAASVTAAGAPVTAATLSYWSSGRSRPARRSSLAVLELLEGVLDVPPGTLLRHVDVAAAPPSPAVPPRRDRAAIAREIADVLADWGLDHDDGLTRDLALARRHLTGEDRRRTGYDLLLRAERDGVDRTVLVFAPPPDLPTVRTDLRPVRGCRSGRTAVTVQGHSLHEILLPRPLRAGESTSITYEWLTEHAGFPSDRFAVWTMAPTRVLVAQVILPDEDDAPSWYRWSATRSGTAGEEIEDCSTWYRVRGRVLQHVMTDIGLGRLCLEWSSSADRPLDGCPSAAQLRRPSADR